MQTSALQNLRSDEADAEILRVVNDMRRNKEPVDRRLRDRVLSIYTSAFTRDEATAQKLLTALPPSDQLETFQALFYDPDFDQAKRPSREVCLARLQETAGRPEDALRTLQAVRSEVAVNASGSMARTVDASIARLSRPAAQSSKAR